MATAQAEQTTQPQTQTSEPEMTNLIAHQPLNNHVLEPAAPQPEPQIAHPMRTRSKNNISKPSKKLTMVVTTTNSDIKIPTTIHQAMRDENWRRSMSVEYNAQIANRTFDLVPPAPSQNVIGSKWIHSLKYLSNGKLDRYKSRWVACGYNQEYGVDYAKTFSSVVKSVTICIVLHLAVTRSWPLKQLDVNNAFLHATLHEEVYVSQPPGFVDPDRPTHVCRLNKALYGLKQALRAWYDELKTFLTQMGCHNSTADTSIFIYLHGVHILYVLVYVDDIIITGSSSSLVTACIHVLASRFSLKEPTDLHYFLGIEVTHTSKGLHLMQKKYIVDLLTKMHMLDAKPVSTPQATSPKLSLLSGTALDNPKEYRMVIGSLQYLAYTRPDIAYSVNRLSQFMHRPTDVHWQASKRIMRYLAGTLSHGVFISTSSPLHLHAFSNADWAGDTDDFVSTNAYIVYLGKAPFAWTSKKQSGVARSSTEAEYR